MLELTQEQTERMEASEREVSALVDAEEEGVEALTSLLRGDRANVEALDRYVQVFEVLRGGRIAGGYKPTEDDVRNARRLVDSVREGAPHEAVVALAMRVFRVSQDPAGLSCLCGVLPLLAGRTTSVDGIRGAPHEYMQNIVRIRLDIALAFFERGGEVEGYVVTPEDLVRVRRLHEIALEDGPERRALAAQLWSRMPRTFTEDVERQLEVNGALQS